MFDEFIDSYKVLQWKILLRNKKEKSLQKAEGHLEHKRASMMELFL